MADTNPFRGYRERILGIVQDQLQTIAAEVVDDMQMNLERKPNIETGDLYNSCSYKMETEGNVISAYIFADAKSESGDLYAEFIEFGTGIYNQKGDGRKTPWRYKDREGNWHTTQGGRPYPFIRPAWAAHEEDFLKLANSLQIEHAISRYRRKIK